MFNTHNAPCRRFVHCGVTATLSTPSNMCNIVVLVRAAGSYAIAIDSQNLHDPRFNSARCIECLICLVCLVHAGRQDPLTAGTARRRLHAAHGKHAQPHVAHSEAFIKVRQHQCDRFRSRSISPDRGEPRPGCVCLLYCVRVSRVSRVSLRMYLFVSFACFVHRVHNNVYLVHRWIRLCCTRSRSKAKRQARRANQMQLAKQLNVRSMVDLLMLRILESKCMSAVWRQCRIIAKVC